ncbi:hypothetical protein [Rhodopila globiformis]|jgi:Ca2+/Na+ antiporter|uniref:Uncharacterized protein n=1 Tax=Rhodopila globiformis TaxID=1071 RepID=A0A2S6MXQ1_RHOGL|nr:hypothetical protein [Rhodopila globiformis]PPQ27142.1 hypothetical protein CCS01_28090 [Rhodopila globiformis]
MHDWLGLGLVALGAGLLAAAVMKRRTPARIAASASSIRPEFAAAGEIVRPMILFVVAMFAATMSLFYFALGGHGTFTMLQYGGVMFVLAAYAVYLMITTTKVAQVQAAETAGPSTSSGA